MSFPKISRTITEQEEHVHEGWQTNDGGYIAIGDNWEGTEEYTNVLVLKINLYASFCSLEQLSHICFWISAIAGSEAYNDSLAKAFRWGASVPNYLASPTTQYE